MEVLYILGNGFDKAQGLATSYKEFYSYYIKQQPESALEKRIMDSINADYETWADLEIGLGNYSASFSSAQEFRDVIILLNLFIFLTYAFNLCLIIYLKRGANW